MAMVGLRRCKLHCDSGSSDKVYELEVVSAGNGLFECLFRNGRRGSTLQGGKKTKGPTTLAEATGAFDRVRREKLGKGYVETFADEVDVEVGAVVAWPAGGMTPRPRPEPTRPDPVVRPVEGMVPQLCAPIDEATMGALLADDAWAMEEKHDGERRVMGLGRGLFGPEGWNRKGQAVQLSKEMLEAGTELAKASGVAVMLDGEQMGDEYVVWTVLAVAGRDMRGETLRERGRALEALDFGPQLAIRRARTAVGEGAKRALLAAVRRKRGEGVVFKRLDGVHQAGPAGGDAGWLKFKFWNTLSAIVAGRNERRSVALALLEADGGELAVGNVTIPSNREVPPEGAVVEVSYLYAYGNGGSLYQPTYIGVRDDVERAECLATQRAFKREDVA